MARIRRLYKRQEAVKFYKWPVPSIVYTKFRAQDSWGLTIPAKVNFYAGNPFDPVVGASVTACSGYAALMSIYAQCLCFACSVKVIAVAGGGTASHCKMYIMWEDHNAQHVGAALARDYVQENRRDCVVKNCYLYNYNVRPCYLKSFRKIKAIEKKKELEPLLYACGPSSGPAGGANYQTYCYVGGVMGSSTGGLTLQVEADVRITYYCKLFNRVDLDG